MAQQHGSTAWLNTAYIALQHVVCLPWALFEFACTPACSHAHEKKYEIHLSIGMHAFSGAVAYNLQMNLACMPGISDTLMDFG